MTVNGRSPVDAAFALPIRRCAANSRITSSTATLSPARATIRSTTPSCAATTTFSIFIASITASRSPARTACPASTATWTSRPGIGESRKRERSGGGLNGISASSSAARGVSTRASTRAPSWATRSASPARSIWARNGAPSTRPWTATSASALANEMRRVRPAIVTR